MISISTILKFSAQINFPSSCLCVNSNLEELRGHKVESVINLTFSWCIVCSCSSMYVLYLYIFIFVVVFCLFVFFQKKEGQSHRAKTVLCYRPRFTPTESLMPSRVFKKSTYSNLFSIKT